jgi:hypothetical protein
MTFGYQPDGVTTLRRERRSVVGWELLEGAAQPHATTTHTLFVKRVTDYR